MYQQRKANIGEVLAANAYDGQCNPSHSSDSSNAVVRSVALDWMGPRAFKAQYGVQPGVHRDFGRWWGPRHDQRLSHHRDTLDSPTGLLYAYDLTWDGYAVLATDIPWAAIEAIINSALASDTRMSAEAIAGLLVDHLVVPAQHLETSAERATGVEL
ncbi:MAG TPA: hypothetical protein VFF32_02460 [Dermatophilaceae bacterium]|nr:hypothetical protein [Dermatophilaceae bacterium]